MHHVIKSLQDTSKQVIGRQATCTLRVRLLPNLRVASVLAEHHTRPDGGNGEGIQGGPELNLKLQLKRHASPLTMLVCSALSCALHSNSYSIHSRKELAQLHRL
jgi:hypothetical protein